jgi:hypothetical protein
VRRSDDCPSVPNHCASVPLALFLYAGTANPKSPIGSAKRPFRPYITKTAMWKTVSLDRRDWRYARNLARSGSLVWASALNASQNLEGSIFGLLWAARQIPAPRLALVML